MKTTPREGDYVRTDGMTESQYHAVGRAFIAAGFGRGEFPDFNQTYKYSNFGINPISGELYHGTKTFEKFRELSLSDLLGDEKVVWSGEGIPPVGAKCEFYYIESLAGVWQTCTIDFIGNNIVVLTTEIESEISVFKQTIKFRPLKSEREAAIEEMINTYKVPVSLEQALFIKHLCEHFYDSDYRKIKDAEK